MNYTTDAGPWPARSWQTMPADLDANAGRVSGDVPDKARVYYFNIVDARNLVVSSEHEECAPSVGGLL